MGTSAPQIDRLKNYLAQDPNNERLVVDLSQAYTQAGEFDAASELLRKAQERIGEVPALTFAESNVALARNDFASAEALLRVLLDKGITAPAIRFNLSYALFFQGQYQQAREQLDEVKSAFNEIPNAPVLYARTCHHLGDLQSAIDALSAKQELTAEEHSVLSLIYLDDENTDEARQHAQAAVELNSRSHEALVTLGTLGLHNQSIEDAEKNFGMALEQHPNSGRAWAGKALATMLKLDIDQAIDELEKAVEYMPNHIGTWHSLAWCYLLKDRVQDAMKAFQRAMDIDARFGETHGGVAVCQIMLGQPDVAKTSITKAKRLDPTGFSAMFAQSLLDSASGDPESAKKRIEEIFSLVQTASGGDFQRMLQKSLSHQHNTRH